MSDDHRCEDIMAPILIYSFIAASNFSGAVAAATGHLLECLLKDVEKKCDFLGNIRTYLIIKRMLYTISVCLFCFWPNSPFEAVLRTRQQCFT